MLMGAGVDADGCRVIGVRLGAAEGVGVQLVGVSVFVGVQLVGVSVAASRGGHIPTPQGGGRYSRHPVWRRCRIEESSHFCGFKLGKLNVTTYQ